MERSPICIRDCRSICCNKAKYLLFTPIEAKLLINASVYLVDKLDSAPDPVSGRKMYTKYGPCTLLEENGKCKKFGHKDRPRICKEFTEGSKECLRFRAENPEGVINLTKKDVEFQNWYFGYDDSC